MFVTHGENPTKMYYQSLNHLLKEGNQLAPRGKSILEVRPACFEFTNPYNRVTFLKNRRINPFFQLAESFWILSGRSDVKFLSFFNENIKTFSDDGDWFNAAYGERLRTWNKNSLHKVIINPIDQLFDVYRKLLHDKDTRQAVAVLSNPMFDNSKYTIDEKGHDIACNLVLTFKIRNNKLDMTVFNRSNDIHWGLFGANLSQFSTIQEVLLSWLRLSGQKEYESLEMGTYNHITDSLHVYTNDYGSKITSTILDAYKTSEDKFSLDITYDFPNEPRMNLSQPQFDGMCSLFWSVIYPEFSRDSIVVTKEFFTDVYDTTSGILKTMKTNGNLDNYWEMAMLSMYAYRLVKLGKLDAAILVLKRIPECSWKLSELEFLTKFISQFEKTSTDLELINFIKTEHEFQLHKCYECQIKEV